MKKCKCQKKQTFGNTQASTSDATKTYTTSNLSVSQHRKEERFVNRSEYHDRLAICKECEKVKYSLGRMRCGECGCFLELKAAVSLMKCPLGKWHAQGRLRELQSSA